MKILAIVGIIAVAYLIFWAGFSLGSEPTTQELEREKTAGDIALVGDKYNELYQLCEKKYQLGIAGDFNSAYTVKGQIEAVEREVNAILAKYNQKAL